MYDNDFWREEGPSDFPESNGCQFCLFVLADWSGIREWCSGLSKSSMHRIEQVWRVLRLRFVADVTLNLKKCKLFENTCYLDLVIRPDRFRLAEHTTDTMGKLKHYTTQLKLVSFSGQWKEFRLFVPNITCRAASVNMILKNGELKQFGALDGKESVEVYLFKSYLSKHIGVGSIDMQC